MMSVMRDNEAHYYQLIRSLSIDSLITTEEQLNYKVCYISDAD